MRRPNKDGIIVDNMLAIQDEYPKEFPAIMRVIQFFVIFLISHNSIWVLIDSLGLFLDFYAVNISIVIITTVVFFLFLTPKYDSAKILGITSIYIILLYKNFDHLSNAFYILENNAIERLASYYEFTPWKYKADYTLAPRDMTGLVIMILIPLIILYTLSVLRGIMTRFSYVIAFLPIAATYAIGMVPSEYQLLIFVLSVLYLSKNKKKIKSVGHNRSNTFIHRTRVRSAYILCVLFLGVYFLIRLFITPAAHENITKISEVKSDIQTFMYDFQLSDISESFNNIVLGKGNSGSQAVGGLNHGQLGEVDTIRYKHSDELQIRLPENMKDDRIYLRGFAGIEYTGRSWEPHNNDAETAYKRIMENIHGEEFEPMNQNPLFLENIKILHLFDFDDDILFSKGKIQIENISGSSQHMYLPYYSDYDSIEESMFMWDLYAFSEKTINQYQVDYYYNISMDLENIFKSSILKEYTTESLEDFKKHSKQYERFVHNYYAKLPEEGLDRIKEDFSGKSAELGISNLYEAIEYTKDYLHRRTKYSLSPGKLPSGEDFVEYFIYDNQVGYCSHYASAATIMLRALGYPARYVEGYTVPIDIDDKTLVGNQQILRYINGEEVKTETLETEVIAKDYNAHAWVDVYVDGFGWVPVEFTPSANDDILSGIINEDSEEIEEATPTPTSTPIEPTNIPSDDNNSSDSGIGSKGNPIIGQIISRILFAILFVVLMITFVTVLKRLKYNRYMSLDYNNKAIYIFKEMQKIFYLSWDLPRRERILEDNLEYVKENYWSLEDEKFDDFVETVKKARFSGDSIKLDELSSVKRCYNKLKVEVYEESSLIKKIIMRIGLVI